MLSPSKPCQEHCIRGKREALAFSSELSNWVPTILRYTREAAYSYLCSLLSCALSMAPISMRMQWSHNIVDLGCLPVLYSLGYGVVQSTKMLACYHQCILRYYWAKRRSAHVTANRKQPKVLDCFSTYYIFWEHIF